MSLLRSWWWLVIAPLFSLVIFRESLGTWFFKDDFAWLGLGLSIHDFPSLLDALFAPKAQGTIRPLSDRLPFLLGYWLFGLDARPFRVFVLTVHSINLMLLAWLVYRWTSSRVAAVAAAIIWTAHSSIAQPLSWTSSMNQVLWPTCILAAFHARELGRKAREWLFFILGFGVLELNVVYPALVLARYPERWRSTLPLFAASGVYTVFHRWVTPPNTNPLYVMDFRPASILETLWKYLQMSMGSFRPDFKPELADFLLGCTIIAVTGFLVGVALERDRLMLFGLSWFLICLGPVLLLRQHISDYYLAVPSAGLGIAFGLAFARRPRLLALPVIAYLAGSLVVSREITHYNRHESNLARNLILGVKQAVALHPDKIILLAGITTDQFWGTVVDDPFRLLPGAKVYLVPGSEKSINAHPELGDPALSILPASAARLALANNQAIVYSAGATPLRNVTNFYRVIAAQEWGNGLANIVDVGQPLLAPQLGSGWENIDHGFRWMGPTAEVTLGGPGNELFVECYRAKNEPRQDLVKLDIYSGPSLLGSLTVPRQDNFVGKLLIPPHLAALPSLLLRLTVTPPVVTPDDGRSLGLAFGKIGRRVTVP